MLCLFNNIFQILLLNLDEFVYYLWSHPIRSSYHRLSLFIALDVCAKTKISHFNCAIHAQQNIVRFDVSMNNTLVKNKQKMDKEVGRKQMVRDLLCYVSTLFHKELRGRRQQSDLL